MDLKESMILGIGNPLLDIIAIVNEEFLKKHSLKENSAISNEESREKFKGTIFPKLKIFSLLGIFSGKK